MRGLKENMKLWKPLYVRVFKCCEMPILYTVEVHYLVTGMIKWVSILGSNLTPKQVNNLVVPDAELWAETHGPIPQIKRKVENAH